MKKYIQITLESLSLAFLSGSLAAIETDAEWLAFVESLPEPSAERAEFFQSPQAHVALDYALANDDLPASDRELFLHRWGLHNWRLDAALAREATQLVVDGILSNNSSLDPRHIPALARTYYRLEGSAAVHDQLLVKAIGVGSVSQHYRMWFGQYLQNLPAAEALPTLEAEIRALLSQPASSTRDAWIKELRAQHVILQGFVQ